MRRLRIEIEVARTDTAPRSVSIAAPPDVSAGAVLDVLGAHLGLPSAAGAVQGRSLISGAWIDRSTRLRDVGLFRGERLSLTVGLAPTESPQPLRRWPAARVADSTGRVAINRPPRSVWREPSLTVSIPTRRKLRPPRRFPLGAMLIPLAIGALLVLVTKRWEIAMFSLFTPVMIGWNYVEERRARSDELREFGQTYEEETAATVKEISTATADWRRWLHTFHPAPNELTQIAAGVTERLWERQPRDPDFLHLRVGRASQRAPITLKEESNSLIIDDDRPDYESYTRAADLPALIDLAGEGVLAVLGEDRELDQALGWIAAQVATLHSPSDVLVCGALTDCEAGGWWQWLPHLATGWLAVGPLATDRNSANRLLDSVVDFATTRRAGKDARGSGGPLPALIVFIDDRLDVDPALVRAVVAAHDVGIMTLWFGSDARAVPTSAPQLLTLDAGGHEAELVGHRGGGRLQVQPEFMSRSALLELSAALAPLRDAADTNRIRNIPDRVSLDELIPDVASPSAIRRRWESASSTALTAYVGMSADGPVTLELGREGSHALVGGTTGAGKSELLQSLVVSLATEYPPSRVGFLLVDYKGGAAFKDAMHLPHCVGVVTDLDQHLTRRVMEALDAEITRREELLAEGGARDVSELRAVRPDLAPADLLIVVDEFATLAKEIPAFVEGVVDIAARGRSLGLRLILATQRPAGVINDRIRANVGARIALRVNDESDSLDVIGERHAAHIPRDTPGRAFLMVHRDLVEFQSAYVGEPAKLGSQEAIESPTSTPQGRRRANIPDRLSPVRPSWRPSSRRPN